MPSFVFGKRDRERALKARALRILGATFTIGLLAGVVLGRMWAGKDL